MERRSFAPDIVVPNDDYACGNKRAGELAPDVAPGELRKEKQVGGPVNCSDSELCTFLLALEAGFLPTYYSDTNQSVQLKSMSIASRSYQRGKKTVVFHGFQSLQMSSILTGDRGEELLTWYLAGFRAKPIHRLLRGKTLQMISGRRCDGSWQMSLPGTYLPRTSPGRQSIRQQTTSSRWVTKPDALNCPRKTWVATTFGEGAGLLHTPTTQANYCAPSMQKWRSCQAWRKTFGEVTPESHEFLMGWPIGWTDLKPLEMGRFQSWLSAHSPRYLERKEAA